MTRPRSLITKAQALRIAYSAVAGVLAGAQGEGYSPAERRGYDPDSVEGRRIDTAFDRIVRQLEAKASAPPRRRRFFGMLLAEHGRPADPIPNSAAPK